MILMSAAVDAWLAELGRTVRGLKSEQEALKQQFRERELQQADLRKRIDELERADAVAARAAPPVPRPVPLSRADDDVGDTNNAKRH